MKKPEEIFLVTSPEGSRGVYLRYYHIAKDPRNPFTKNTLQQYRNDGRGPEIGKPCHPIKGSAKGWVIEVLPIDGMEAV